MNSFNYPIAILEIIKEIENHPDARLGGGPEIRKVKERILSGNDLFPKLPYFATYAGFEYLNNEYQEKIALWG